MFEGGIMWDDENGDCNYIKISTMDLKGYFPMRLLNMAIGSMIKKQMVTIYDKLLVLEAKRK